MERRRKKERERETARMEGEGVRGGDEREERERGRGRHDWNKCKKGQGQTGATPGSLTIETPPQSDTTLAWFLMYVNVSARETDRQTDRQTERDRETERRGKGGRDRQTAAQRDKERQTISPTIPRSLFIHQTTVHLKPSKTIRTAQGSGVKGQGIQVQDTLAWLALEAGRMVVVVALVVVEWKSLWR